MNTTEVLELMQRVAEEVINPRFRSLGDHQIDEKNPGDLVTVADREAEERLTDALSSAYPDALVLGEEATATDDTLLPRFRDADHAFTIDPVDGTKNFVSGSRNHAVMAAELRAGEVLRSWIWQPQLGQAYVAERGGGAWRNGERLVRPPVGAQPRGVTSRRRWIGRALDGLPPLELTWVCCGVDYPKLVEGEADYLVYRGTQPWDHSPGSLILEESGAFLGTFEGGLYRPQDDPPAGIIAAADRATYDRVQAHVAELG
ncbi:MAG TPA: inositol monophosphatase [Nocardioides sp.]|uniref:inositol monophosphatase family protein n=1 Tax=Nocardioides sp. TaxID=35761 RepID=UPI002E2F2AE5|nr:inositol monophosphatase [Nocardioides sp.]HEX5090268.1 inositol monophosphatase [Nocardioides sp.]